jgi:WD40 repeat protein
LKTGQPIGSPLIHGEGLTAVAYSADGLRIATGGSDGVAHVWDATTGRPLIKPLVHRRGVWSVAFSPDGSRLATATGDGDVRIWDARTGEPITPPLKHRSNVRHVAFSSDGQRLALAGGSADKLGEVRIWELQANRLPLRDLERIARLLAAAEIGEMSGLDGLSTEVIVRLWSELRSTHPELFSVSQEERIRWHQTQAEECEHRANWFGASFHLGRLARLDGTNVEWAKRLKFVEAELSQDLGK